MRKKIFIIATLIFFSCAFNVRAEEMASATIQATVPDRGQGTGTPDKPNVAQDMTQEFQYRYGVHTVADSIGSDLLFWVFLLFILAIGLYTAFDVDQYVHKREKMMRMKR